MDPTAWSPATWSALAAWATVAVYVVLGLFAWRQVSEARRLREEQARPWVVVDFDVGFVVWVSIENMGRTVATDVRIRFNPPLVSSQAKPWPWEESTLLTHGIPTLPPGRKLRLFFDSFPVRLQSNLPRTYEVNVEYHGPAVKTRLLTRKKQPFTSHYRLDLNFHVGMSPLPKGLPEVATELEKIRKELHKWTDLGGGLKVFAVDRDKKTRYQSRHVWAQEALRVKREQGLLAFSRHLVERALRRRGWLH